VKLLHAQDVTGHADWPPGGTRVKRHRRGVLQAARATLDNVILRGDMEQAESRHNRHHDLRLSYY
jgi:hypothetical protein